jgi:hypothetical protein
MRAALGRHRPADYAADVAEDLADVEAARASLAEAGDNIPWEQVRSEAGL